MDVRDGKLKKNKVNQLFYYLLLLGLTDIPDNLSASFTSDNLVIRLSFWYTFKLFSNELYVI